MSALQKYYLVEEAVNCILGYVSRFFFTKCFNPFDWFMGAMYYSYTKTHDINWWQMISCFIVWLFLSSLGGQITDACFRD